MRKRSLKNSKHLVELIHGCTPAALRLLAEAERFDFLQPLDWTQDGPDLREAAITTIAELPQELASKIDQEAVRLIQLSGWRTGELLEFATATPAFLWSDHPDFDGQADDLIQLIWFLARLPTVFDQLETIYLAYHFHGHKKFKPFKVRDGQHRPFEWTEEIAQKLQTKVGDILALQGAARDNCEVIHFEMEDTGNDSTAVPKLLHYVVVYHPGKMKLLRQMKDRRRDLLAFYPALEATLVYDPAKNRIMVLADKMATRVALAECFSEIGFDQPLSAEPLEQMSYDLSPFRSPVDLLAPRVPGVLIEQAWVAGMTVSLGHTAHKVALMMAGSTDFWQVLDEEFGAADPLSRAGFLYEVRLSFVVRFDGEAHARALDLSITPKTCSLWSLPDRALRSCGEEILLALGVMKPVQADFDGVDSQGLLAELALLDEPGEAIDGFRLREMNLPAAELENHGVIRKRALSKVVTRLRDEDEADREPVFQRLEVQSDSRRSWAVDPLTGQNVILSEGDLCGYTVNRAWLHERLSAQLASQLSGLPLEPETKEPLFLGFYRFGDQDIPIHLATRLWRDKQAEAMDVDIRKQGLGLGVVLTTTQRRCRTFLGSSLVVPIARLIDEGLDGAEINLSGIEPEFRRWRGLAETADEPRLIKEAHGAVLVGPWLEPWPLSKAEHIASVDVLVKAWLSGKRKCTKDQVLADFAGARNVPERFRDDPRWKIYIRPGDRLQRPRLWELNIGQPDAATAADTL